MKLHNELHNVTVADGPGRSVEGVIRVRGLGMQVRGRGVTFRQQQPVGVVVHTRSGVQRLALPRDDAVPGVAAALAGPILFLATKRFLKKGRRR
ncbi:MAG: hypothetical protein WEB52_07040 [Dehalococcoidia bacterium]